MLADVRRLARADMPADLPPRELMRLRDTLRAAPSMVPWLLPTRRWGKLTMGDLAARFQSPLLRDALRRAHARADGRHGAARDHGVAARRRRRLPAGRLAADGPQPRAPLRRARRRDHGTTRASRGSSPSARARGDRADRSRARRRHRWSPRRSSSPPPTVTPPSTTCWAARTWTTSCATCTSATRCRCSPRSCSSAWASRATSPTSPGGSPGCASPSTEPIAAGSVQTDGPRRARQQLRPGARARRARPCITSAHRGRRPLLDRAARARPGAVQGGEGAHRRRRRARPRPPLPGPRRSRSRWWTWPRRRRPSATRATGAPASRASCRRRAT